MSAIPSELERDHSTYEEELRKRAWETLPNVYKLALFIHEKFANSPFEGSQLYNEFLKNFPLRRDLVRQLMEELKKKGYVVQFKRISHRKRLWVASADLFEHATRIREKVDKQMYLMNLPKVSFQLRGYLRLLKSTRGSHLIVFSKALSDAASKQTIRCGIYRFKDAFVIKSGRGAKACPRRWEIDLPVPKCLLYKNELDALNAGKMLPRVIYVVPRDWGLKKWDFFTETPEARKLVKALSKHFVIDVLPSHNYHVNKWRFDILTENFVVEITAYKPKPTKCGPHSSQASVIGAKVLDGLLYSLEKRKKSIIVVSSAWRKKPYLLDLKATVQRYGCYIFFADFNRAGWTEEIASQIVEISNAPRL